MALEQLREVMQPAIEAELQRQIARANQPGTRQFFEMLAYHMGWSGEARVSGSGKRIRPLVTLLVVSACGGEWLRAVPAAAAVEIVHNFSLLHDDIEDNSITRRGRVTAWKRYGVPMAINLGDALFAISNQAMLEVSGNYPVESVLTAAACLNDACLALTCGQYLDMSYEKQIGLSVEDYWPMVSGKTAALLAAAARIGAILGAADNAVIQSYTDFARYLGLAFQVQDDILGIWGDEATTGKSAASDLTEGKNSLPILFGLKYDPEFARRWERGSIAVEEAHGIAQTLRALGAYDYAFGEAERLNLLAMNALEASQPAGEPGKALAELAADLLHRQS
jgi:geranylgeranyl diphosphate synthase, type I